MDKTIHDAVSWYQCKIDNYDRVNWEHRIEQRILKGLENRPKKDGILKTGLIDVDLVRGSAFSKAKPEHSLTTVFKRGLYRVLFFPFYMKWWRGHTSSRICIFLLCIYFLQLLQILLYAWDIDGRSVQPEFTQSELLIPVALGIFLGVLHSQIVATHHKKSSLNNRTVSSPSMATTTTTKSTSAASTNKKKIYRPRTVAPSDDNKGSNSNSSLSGRRKKYNYQSTGSTATVSPAGLNAEESDYAESLIIDTEVDDLNTVTAPPLPRDSLHFDPTSIIKKASSCLSSDAFATTTTSSSSVSITTSMTPNAKKSVALAVTNFDCSKSTKSLNLKHAEQMDDFVKFKTAKNKKIPDPTPPKDKTATSMVALSSPIFNLRMRNRSARLSGGESFPNHSPTMSQKNSPVKHMSRRNLSNTEIQIPSERLRAHSASAHMKVGRQLSTESQVMNRCSSDTGQDGAVCELDPFALDDDDEADETKEHLWNNRDVETHDGDAEESSTSSIEDDKAGASCLVSDTNLVSATMQSSSGVVADVCEEDFNSEQDTFNSMTQRKVMFSELFKKRAQLNSSGSNSNKVRHGTGLWCSVDAVVIDTKDGDIVVPAGLDAAVVNAAPIQIDSSSTDEEEKPKMTGEASNSSGGLLRLPAVSQLLKSQASETEFELYKLDTEHSSSSEAAASQDDGSHVESRAKNDEALQDPVPEDPWYLWYRETQQGGALSHQASSAREDKVSCYVWEANEQVQKMELSLLDIGWSIIQAVEKIPENCDYQRFSVVLVILLGSLPLIFRGYTNSHELYKLPDLFATELSWNNSLTTLPNLVGRVFLGSNWRVTLLVVLGVILRTSFHSLFLFLLCVVERVYSQRLLYAKHFSYLTSSRRARKYELPHFRLNKVCNIKNWLSLRSYLKKRGPQRSADSIIQAAFYLTTFLVSIICILMLREKNDFFESLLNWDMSVWIVALGVFLIRFLTLATQVTKKFRNLSVLLTEQINLYLYMENKSLKKREELMLANNVLKLAVELLKEVDGPFRICGYAINPVLYNILKVFILSAFSAVLTSMLGFKLKLYKIKMNPVNW